MSGSTPLSNTAEMLTEPRDVEDELEIEQSVDPGQLRSSTWVTLLSSVAADAPG